ncbi:hypothetical protein RF11_14665 [Thelohanellus kitauei]|uniref:Uncharacterized protein n=1 Tax=Thelohanellus kitauei TaxID=669202 RepID=A0A0C2J4Q1_THEKT|nr:hypothetical protein RF11_14665 [Thelohanellus kitauei]
MKNQIDFVSNDFVVYECLAEFWCYMRFVIRLITIPTNHMVIVCNIVLDMYSKLLNPKEFHRFYSMILAFIDLGFFDLKDYLIFRCQIDEIAVKSPKMYI